MFYVEPYPALFCRIGCGIEHERLKAERVKNSQCFLELSFMRFLWFAAGVAKVLKTRRARHLLFLILVVPPATVNYEMRYAGIAIKRAGEADKTLLTFAFKEKGLLAGLLRFPTIGKGNCSNEQDRP